MEKVKIDKEKSGEKRKKMGGRGREKNGRRVKGRRRGWGRERGLFF